MNQGFFNLIIIGGIFLALFAVGEILFHVLKVKGEYTRKFVHAVTGVITLLFPIYFDSHWFVLGLCAMFAIILQVSLRIDFLKSINSIDRDSYGSITYPVSVYGIFLFARYAHGDILEPAFYYIPILTLALCDPIAAIVGRNFPWKPFRVGEGTKTGAGTLAFFVSAVILEFILLRTLTGTSPMNCLVLALALAFLTSVAEAVSRKGLDNLFVPAIAAAALYFFSEFTPFYQSMHG
jgi:phytol kinase